MDPGPSTPPQNGIEASSTSDSIEDIQQPGPSRPAACHGASMGSGSDTVVEDDDDDRVLQLLGETSPSSGDDVSVAGPIFRNHQRETVSRSSRNAPGRNDIGPPRSPYPFNAYTRSATHLATGSEPTTLRRGGYESDDSMPSMQTVSDSSEEDLDNGAWVSDEDEDEDADSEGGDDDEPDLGAPPVFSPVESERLRALFSEDNEDLGEEPENPFSGFLDLINASSSLGTAINNAAETLGINMSDLPSNLSFDSQMRLPSVALLQALSQQMRMVFDPHNHPPEQHEDPHRAEVIIKQLEKIPSPLITRYEHLRKGDGEYDDEGCAICRDAYILEPEEPTPQMVETDLLFEALPFRLPKGRPERILAFPCQGMHLFHAGCLGPWLARKTTCPTCRFDIDPDSLTLRGQRDPISGRSLSKLWAPPSGRNFVRWLEGEEARRGQHPANMSETSFADPLSTSVYPNDSEPEDGDDEYEDSDSEDEQSTYDSDQSPLDLYGDPFHSTGLRDVPPNVAQSMLAALTMSAEPAMGNEYDDEEGYFGPPEMAFAMDYDDGLSMLMPGPPSRVLESGGESDSDASTDENMPPLAEVSDDDESSLTAGLTDGMEDEEDEPDLGPTGSSGDDDLSDTAAEILSILNRPGTSQLPPPVRTATPPTNTDSQIPPTSATTFISATQLIADRAPSPPQLMENRMNSLGIGRLLSPLDLMRGSMASSLQTNSPIATGGGSNQTPTTQTEEPTSPLRSILRNFAPWRSIRPSSSPPNSNMDVVD
ncbi:hypothetical protein BDY19DRAFT_957951 [Irpex rosettiformis]|uniref:Uncharacterized protein n=1 Tax=Irpex rosettiformis TaxID=378272 RepID=A0ACB8TY79_9APHY|nr:hypothetical protein BDY19DRAFT_957951 [Irpex rosettiformis]